jgi:hypothetical protein
MKMKKMQFMSELHTKVVAPFDVYGFFNISAFSYLVNLLVIISILFKKKEVRSMLACMNEFFWF